MTSILDGSSVRDGAEVHTPSGRHTLRRPVFNWYLPTRGDSHDPGVITPVEGLVHRPDRTADLDYLALVAGAAERAGFDAALTPVGLACIDPWILCSALAARTSHLKYIIAFRPSLASATLLAQQADTFRRLFGERLILNVTTGGSPVEQAAYGEHGSHDERYQRTDEALQVIRPLLAGEQVTVRGDHLDVRDARLTNPGTASVPIYFGGASPAAVDVAARQADTYLLWGEPPADVAERIRVVKARAAAVGRTLRFGLRVHILTRDTAAQAWDTAEQMLARFDPSAVAGLQRRLAGMDSHGQARMTALHPGRSVRSADLVVSPNLWAGIGLVREGVATAVVGSHDEVAARLSDYVDLGVDEFILSGYPHLEESLRVGEEIIPRVHALRTQIGAA
ncbi:LLM class flavin-dependent oxidoreductase [Nakamurella silvestris]|nr:LLM class flavin-dependent oxidoreductase [Nakamurella silvestris]